MKKQRKNKGRDYGNVTFGEATELLDDIIGQIVILKSISKEKQSKEK